MVQRRAMWQTRINACIAECTHAFAHECMYDSACHWRLIIGYGLLIIPTID